MYSKNFNFFVKNKYIFCTYTSKKNKFHVLYVKVKKSNGQKDFSHTNKITPK